MFFEISFDGVKFAGIIAPVNSHNLIGFSVSHWKYFAVAR